MSFSVRVKVARRLRFLPHPLFASAMHAMFQGELSTLRRPRTYSQLLAAKNLRPQPPLVHVTADKYAVRRHVAERVGEQYLIPLLQVADDADDLDLDALQGPCVIKGTHGCDMTLLVPDPAALDHDAVRATVRGWLDTDFYRAGWRESPYRGPAPARRRRASSSATGARRPRTTSSSSSTASRRWSSSTRTGSPGTPRRCSPRTGASWR